eukprot:jgi/Botrbrau1/22164/Bobra.0451s0001.2
MRLRSAHQGRWSTQNDPVFFLHLPDTESGPQLKDYISSYVSKYARLHGLKIGDDKTDLKILVFGDSVDRLMVADACNFQIPPLKSGSPAPRPCDSPHFVLRTHHIPGSHRSGPYHCTSTNCQWDSPYLFIEKELREFEKNYGATWHGRPLNNLVGYSTAARPHQPYSCRAAFARNHKWLGS